MKLLKAIISFGLQFDASYTFLIKLQTNNFRHFLCILEGGQWLHALKYNYTTLFSQKMYGKMQGPLCQKAFKQGGQCAIKAGMMA